METIKARVVNDDGKYSITIDAEDGEIRIPMSEDNPNEVKRAFNKILTRLRNGEFQIELVDLGEDLFSQVANEYAAQLNREIQEVFGEMQHHGLCESETPDSPVIGTAPDQ